jgi:hypothetical protein
MRRPFFRNRAADNGADAREFLERKRDRPATAVAATYGITAALCSPADETQNAMMVDYLKASARRSGVTTDC